MDNKKIPEAITRRLPIYYRNICAFEAEGYTKITSSMLGERTGNSGVQVRQDFFTCGGAPQYTIPELKNWFEIKFGLKEKHRAVIVGAGNLGRALMNCKDYKSEIFFIAAAFDNNLMFEGMDVGGIPIINVQFLDNYLKNNDVDILVITTPASAAKDIFNIAVQNNIRGVWNFSPVDLKSKEKTIVNNVNISDSLLTLFMELENNA